MKGKIKCRKQCTASPFIKEGAEIKNNSSTWKINKKLNCDSFNIVYIIECQKEKCIRNNNYRYIGESKRPLKHKLADHHGYTLNEKGNQATGHHFTLSGHNLSHLKIIILEKNCDLYRKEREKYPIRKLNTFYSTLNRKV